jgi:urea carboxylase-associated protein 2
MPFAFADLPPLARAAVPDHSTLFDPSLVLWEAAMPGGASWSGRMRRGTTLRCTDLTGRANLSVLMFALDFPTERYNMPDTLKGQHTAYLTQGHVCVSDMGRVLCSIALDTCGWHDTVCGMLDAAATRAKYAEAPYQTHRNAWHRNGTDSLLVELGKWGLGKRDLVANLNLFSKAAPDAAGRLHFDTAHRAPGQLVDLRFETDVLLVLSATPHPLDPSPVYDPQPLQLTAWRSGSAGADDPCRLHCEQNGRAFLLTERDHL